MNAMGKLVGRRLRGLVQVMWSYVQLADETQIAYSDLREDGTLEVAVERPVDMGFDSARCLLPAHRWFDVTGFSDEELAELDSFVRNNAPFIFELAERRASGQTIA